jgi:SAM-dependent methyltransferase
MKYANYLRKLFPDISLHVEDLLFLESFQIKYLPDRVLKNELAVLLRENPVIHRYFVAMCPSVKSFIDEILERNVDIDKTINESCDDLLWEIADLIVYNKYPEIYNENIDFPWEIDEIISPQVLKGKTVVDAGAGPGKLSFLLAQYAETVYAMEPVRGFRQFIKDKIKNKKVKNVFVIDGFLDSIPFPENSVDYLITSNAIGWNIMGELSEIERILKPDGCTIHLFKDADTDDEAVKQLNDILTSSDWNYSCERCKSTLGCKLKYHKTIV